MPHVTLLFPVYNAAPWLAAAVQSLQTQTHAELSLLILDDGSTDASPHILADLARQDARIHLRHQPNAGAVATLNRLIDWSLSDATLPRADFIALMHADDLSLPTRIEKQLAHFAANPTLDLCGTWIQEFTDPLETRNSKLETRNLTLETGNSKLETRTWHYPSDPRFTKPYLLFWCCFAHPTMMFRRRALEGAPSSSLTAHHASPPLRYDPAFPMPCEDYALWARAAEHYTLGNVPEVLLHYRLHPAQASAARRQATADLTRRIRQSLLTSLGIIPTEADLDLHQRLADSDSPTCLSPTATLDFLHATRAWLEHLLGANSQTRTYDAHAFQKILAARWAATCLHIATGALQSIPTLWPEFWSSPLAAHVDRTLPKNHPIPDP